MRLVLSSNLSINEAFWYHKKFVLNIRCILCLYFFHILTSSITVFEANMIKSYVKNLKQDKMEVKKFFYEFSFNKCFRSGIHSLLKRTGAKCSNYIIYSSFTHDVTASQARHSN